jgi:hypothetical protein
MTSNYKTDEIETLREKIRIAEKRLARIGDEWLKRVQREEINFMRQRIRQLEAE